MIPHLETVMMMMKGEDQGFTLPRIATMPFQRLHKMHSHYLILPSPAPRMSGALQLILRSPQLLRQSVC